MLSLLLLVCFVTFLSSETVIQKSSRSKRAQSENLDLGNQSISRIESASIFRHKRLIESVSKKNGSDIKCDKYMCDCNGKIAKCTGQDGRRVMYMPQLPANIRQFRMMRGNFPWLNRSIMANVSNFLLTHINLTSNQIQHLDANTFMDFPHLENLDLSFNGISLQLLRNCFQYLSK